MAKKGDCCVFTVAAALACLFLGGVFTFLAIDEHRKPRYYVAIDSVSGLDVGGDLAAAALLLDLVFNLTIRVASLGLTHGECVEPGTAVEVSYRGVPLAMGTARRLCAGPRKGPVEQHVVAWGRGVRLPGFALDGLAAEVRGSGGSVEQVAFDVTLLMPSTHDSGHEGKMVACRGRRAGDAAAAAALATPCETSDVDAVLIPSPDVHYDARVRHHRTKSSGCWDRI